MIVSPLRMPAPVGAALSVADVVGGAADRLMVVLPVFCHQGHGLPPVPGGMLVPNVIQSPLPTPPAATFTDIVTVVAFELETFVPKGNRGGLRRVLDRQAHDSGRNYSAGERQNFPGGRRLACRRARVGHQRQRPGIEGGLRGSYHTCYGQRLAGGGRARGCWPLRNRKS